MITQAFLLPRHASFDSNRLEAMRLPEMTDHGRRPDEICHRLYREWLIPAALINARMSVRLVDEEEIERDSGGAGQARGVRPVPQNDGSRAHHPAA